MNNNMTETIVAISTGTGSGAISIVRMSGSKAIEIADEIFSTAKNNKPSSFEPRMLTLGKVKTKTFDEQAMCVCFKAPKSYTGEDMVEFQCHGGSQIASGIMRECLSRGARVATNGEFTKRAFLNGKMTLSSAEGMMDMINAESDAEVRAGYNLLSGTLSKLAFFAQDELTDVLSEIEVSFDYPEETIEYITKAKIKEKLSNLKEKIDEVLKTSRTGKMIKSGINVLIVGKPNVGKSSLLNALLQKERAIVTDVAGTTRDTIEETMLLDDVKVNLIDTAGIHDTTDKVEKIGVDKAKDLIKQADIVLFLVDSNREFTKEDKDIFESIQKSNYIVVKTKSDLKQANAKHFDGEIFVSNTNLSGIAELKDRIKQLTNLSNVSSASVIITNERHKEALEHASKSLTTALENLESDSLDLISIDIKDAYTSLGEITGTTTSEKIIDQIFKKFCLGK